MPLDMAVIAAPQLMRLDPLVWRTKLAAFAQAKRDKKALDAQARALDNAIKAVQAEALAALAGAPAAICGEIVVTAKATTAAPASVTLSDGRVVPWSTVASVLIGNVMVPADQVLKIFGGRDGSLSVEVTGC